jgi:hypothetical protein
MELGRLRHGLIVDPDDPAQSQIAEVNRVVVDAWEKGSHIGGLSRSQFKRLRRLKDRRRKDKKLTRDKLQTPGIKAD